jgi:hypothetical protein
MTIHFDALLAFEKECKRLQKKYQSLDTDLEEFKKVIAIIPLGNSKHFTIIKDSDEMSILKARLFCRYLKGSSLRIIYSYNRKTNHITFIELYFKGEKENEDRERIEGFMSSI